MLDRIALLNRRFPTVRLHQSLLLALGKLNDHIASSYTYLKSNQFLALQACEHHDTVINLSTGYGKSLIFYILPFLHDSLCGVIICTPLNSIIEDQAKKLGSKLLIVDQKLLLDIKKNNSKSVSLQKLKRREYHYLIGHPEQLTSVDFKTFLDWPEIKNYFRYLVVDESHCLLSWGKSKFRPAFLKIRQLRAFLPRKSVRFIAMTATATVEDKRDIAQLLDMKDHLEVGSNPDR